MHNPHDEVKSVLKPVMDMYEGLPLDEKQEMFEESVTAQFLSIIDTIRTLRPEVVQELIHLVCSDEVDSELLPKDWKRICDRYHIGHLGHVAYLTLFILLVSKVADWVKEETKGRTFQEASAELPKGKTFQDIVWPEKDSLDAIDIAMARALKNSKFNSMN